MSVSVHERRPPEIELLLAALERHGVQYVLVGSAAAWMYGMEIDPRDLDIVPALDHANLGRLAALLREIEAWPTETFGRWEALSNDEWTWVAEAATEARRDVLARWWADPADARTFDHLFTSCRGDFDVVPRVAGPFDDLFSRARPMVHAGVTVHVAHVDDLLAKLTVARRDKDVARVSALRAMQRRGDGRL